MRISGVVAGLALSLAACGGGSGGGGSTGTSSTASGNAVAAAGLSAQAQLGELIFHDASLSASGRMACATCHVKAEGDAQANALAAQLGGPGLDQQGSRVAPSIRYLSFNTPFFFAADGTPTGGFFWDGRAGSLQAQAGQPFLNAVEMANASVADVADKLSRASYAATFKQVFGNDIFSRPDDAFARMTLALQAYEREDTDFRAFSSKYDAFLQGRASLADAELRGLALFNDPAKGNCAACHPSAKGSDGSLPLFTDFTYDTLGVPRNPELVQNANPAFYDLGLCARTVGGVADLATHTDLCGAFKVPSLRNVALRKAFFHNGRFKTLKDALTFYVQRDTNPEKWYPLNPDGSVHKFDDLPAAYVRNVNTLEVPYNRQPGMAPALSDAEIDDVIAFLGTLTDNVSP
jgi:cytochrome c peroxidase